MLASLLSLLLLLGETPGGLPVPATAATAPNRAPRARHSGDSCRGAGVGATPSACSASAGSSHVVGGARHAGPVLRRQARGSARRVFLSLDTQRVRPRDPYPDPCIVRRSAPASATASPSPQTVGMPPSRAHTAAEAAAAAAAAAAAGAHAVGVAQASPVCVAPAVPGAGAGCGSSAGGGGGGTAGPSSPRCDAAAPAGAGYEVSRADSGSGGAAGAGGPAALRAGSGGASASKAARAACNPRRRDAFKSCVDRPELSQPTHSHPQK